MSKRSTIVILLFIVSCIGIYFTPHLAVSNMRKAAQDNDPDRLSDYVDYAALRESLKANFNATMASEVAKSKSGNPFGALGATLAAMIVNPMIDALVTPESLAMLLSGKKPQIGKSNSSRKSIYTKMENDPEITMSYEGLHRFVVKNKPKDPSEEPVKLIYKRNGFISWKLSAVRFPLEKDKSIFNKKPLKLSKLDSPIKEKEEKP